MAIVDITPKPKQYFIQKNEEGQRSPLSAIEISGLWKPESLGRVIVEEYQAEDSLLAQLMIQGRESTASTDQVVWKEEDNDFSINPITGKGIVTRAANVFSLNTASINPDPYDIDSNRPATAQFIVTVGMNFSVFDSTGKYDHGQITAVATDNLSFTATVYGEGKSAWTIGTADLDIIFTGLDLDHCECPTGIGYKTYAPVRENTMQKDGDSVEYCEETLANEGAGSYDLYEVGNGDFVELDERLNRAQKNLLKTADFRLAFGERKTIAQATALGQKSVGMRGLLPILETRALKIDGMIESFSDFTKIANYLKKEGIRSATIRCTDKQMEKINALVTPTSPYYINPFQDNTNSMFYIGFGGVKVNDVTIIFKEWSALNMLSENVAERYNFVVIPEGKLTKVINGVRQNVGYVEIVWFKAFNKVYKFLRDKDGEEKKCGKTKVDYLNKFTVAVFHPEKFILGINIPE